MFKAYNYSIYPTLDQQIMLIRSFASAFWFYYYSLDNTSHKYKQTAKGLNPNQIIHLLTQLKKRHECFNETPF